MTDHDRTPPQETPDTLREALTHLLDMIDAQKRDETPSPKRESADDFSSRTERDEVFWEAVANARAALVTPASQESSSNDAVLRAALAQWKCPGCGGSGKYQQDAKGRARAEERGKATDPKYQPDPVTCKVCQGGGLHPIASAALARVPAASTQFTPAAAREQNGSSTPRPPASAAMGHSAGVDTAPSDEQINEAILQFARERGRSINLTYDSGTYVVTKPTGAAINFAKAIVELCEPHSPTGNIGEEQLALEFLRLFVADRKGEADAFDSARAFLTKFDVRRRP